MKRQSTRKQPTATFKPGFEVMNLKTHRSHGVFDTKDEALGCVAYDRLISWQIWRNGSVLVAERDLS